MEFQTPLPLKYSDVFYGWPFTKLTKNKFLFIEELQSNHVSNPCQQKPGFEPDILPWLDLSIATDNELTFKKLWAFSSFSSSFCCTKNCNSLSTQNWAMPVWVSWRSPQRKLANLYDLYNDCSIWRRKLYNPSNFTDKLMTSLSSVCGCTREIA